MEHESNIQKLDFAVLVPQAQRGDSIAVNSQQPFAGFYADGTGV